MSQPQVTIEQGTLRGSIGVDIKRGKFYKFQGIPYAKPPLRELRFKAPLPPEKWYGIFDATKEGDISYHRDPMRNWKVTGSENCLVLNVYTKQLDDTELKPVLFWIHGGGFLWGHGGEELYAPDFLMIEDVVVVTINYRLGIFGFVSFEDSSLDIPGNAGLKDQVMALKWVQKNISNFGGDPNNVTIFGESAGGVAVHLHMLSPMSKGLFHKAIVQSGCALSPWTKAKVGVQEIASMMGLDGADERTVYNSLMIKSKEDILGIQAKLPDNWLPIEYRSLGVVVEKNAKNPFLPDEPMNIITSGNFTHVPLIIGFNSCEAMVFEFFKLQNPRLLNFTFDNVVPHFFGYEAGAPDTIAVGETIKKFYFGDEQLSEKNVKKKYDMFTDSSFIYPLYITLKAQLKVTKTPIYLYQMSIETKLNFFRQLLEIKIHGVSHQDDTGYFFKHILTPVIKPGSIEDIARKRFVKLWGNFAKCGNPTPDEIDYILKQTKWKPVVDSNLDYLDIGRNLVMMSNPNPERIAFWEKLFAECPAKNNKLFI